MIVIKMTNELLEAFTGGKFPRGAGNPVRCNVFREYYIMQSVDDIEEFIKDNKETNCFLSVYSFTEYTQEIRNKMSAIIDVLVFDFDDSECPSNCLDDINVLLKWASRHNISPRIHFTGGRGFHAFIDIEPIKLEHTQEVLRRFSYEMSKAAGFKTNDLCIAGDLERVIRIPNTIHPKTGLYCIGLNNKTIPYLSIDNIKALARNKSTYVPVRQPVAGEIHELLHEYDEIIGQEIEEMKAKLEAMKEAEKNSLFPGIPLGIPCLAFKDCMANGAAEGSRSYCAAGIAQKCKKDGWTFDKSFNIMKEFGSKCDPVMSDGELKKILKYHWDHDYSICTFFSKVNESCLYCSNRTF